jgi:hypothetical protein
MMRVAAAKGALGRIVLRDGEHLLGQEKRNGRKRLIADESSGFSAGSPPAPVLTERAGYVDAGTGLSQYGNVDERLLSYWLREDAIEAGPGSSHDQTFALRGIQDAELTAILDRPRALQAGQRVSKDLESKLLASSGPEFVTTSGRAESSSMTAVTGLNEVHEREPQPRQMELVGSHSHQAVGKPPAAPSSGLKILPGGVSEQVAITIQREMDEWETIGANAPYTPSKGAGYEFVYHQASRVLLPSSSASGLAADVSDAELAKTKSEVLALAAEVALHAEEEAPQEALAPTFKKKAAAKKRGTAQAPQRGEDSRVHRVTETK